MSDLLARFVAAIPPAGVLSTGMLPAVMLLVLTSLLVPVPAVADESPRPVRLHAALPDTLDAATVTRFMLFPDLEQVQQVYFVPAPWGGYLARIQVRRDGKPVLLERSVPLTRWRDLQERVAAVLAGGRPVIGTTPDPAEEPAAGDPGGDRIRTWPETPLPPTIPRARPEVENDVPPVKLHGHWLAILELGYRHNVTDFREYFTDMGMIGVAFGWALGEHLVPHFGVEIGFGDIQRDFEGIAGDGRANSYAFVLGLLSKVSVNRNSQFYCSGAGGYFIRSLQWGDPFAYGSYYYDTGYTLEQQDWGFEFRVGFMKRKGGGTKPRFWDLGVSIQTSIAETWEYYENDQHFFAGDRDTWLTLAFRLWDGI